MKCLITVKGMRVFTEVEETREVEIAIGCGVRFIFHGTKYSGLGEVVEIDEPGRRLRLTAPGLNTWVDLEAVRDVVSKDDLYNSRLQNQIDYSIIES